MIKTGFLLVLITLLFCRCSDSTEAQYKAMEKTELESGVRYDSLFKGLYFGMKHQSFRDYCYYKNTVEHDFIMAGSNTSWLESKLDGEMNYPAAINFYPVFADGVITEMNASVYYDNATFRDGTFDKDSLLLDVMSMMERWYGRPFLKIKSPYAFKDDIYVSIRGNRRVTIYPAATPEIKIWIVDLYAKMKRGKNSNDSKVQSKK
jgi:hypothetical protein